MLTVNLISAFLVAVSANVEFCENTKVLSICRLPTHYVGHVDQIFYRKFVDVRGVPILGTASTSSAALIEAGRIISKMIERAPSLYADHIVLRRDRVVVLGRDEKIHDLPEFRNQNDRRLWELRGYNSLGVVVCAEENLLCRENDDYRGYSVCLHEFAHSLDGSFTRIDPAYKKLIVSAYRSAVLDRNENVRLWKGTYAASDPAEYFAELSVSWFDGSSKDVVPGSFNGVWNRQQLKNYDPLMADLLKRIYGDEHWRYSCGAVCRDPVVEDFTC